MHAISCAFSISGRSRSLFTKVEEVIFNLFSILSLFSVALAPLPFKPNSGALDSWVRYIGWYLVKYQLAGGGGGALDLIWNTKFAFNSNITWHIRLITASPICHHHFGYFFQIVASVTLSICIRLQISDKCLGAIPEWFRWGNRKVNGVLNVFRPHANIN